MWRALGYASLRVEDVAARAGVNKTTIYRRWPAKSDLVIAALDALRDQTQIDPDTGSLREEGDSSPRASAVFRRTDPPRSGGDRQSVPSQHGSGGR